MPLTAALEPVPHGDPSPVSSTAPRDTPGPPGLVAETLVADDPDALAFLRTAAFVPGRVATVAAGPGAAPSGPTSRRPAAPGASAASGSSIGARTLDDRTRRPPNAMFSPRRSSRVGRRPSMANPRPSCAPTFCSRESSYPRALTALSYATGLTRSALDYSLAWPPRSPLPRSLCLSADRPRSLISRRPHGSRRRSYPGMRPAILRRVLTANGCGFAGGPPDGTAVRGGGALSVDQAARAARGAARGRRGRG